MIDLSWIKLIIIWIIFSKIRRGDQWLPGHNRNRRDDIRLPNLQRVLRHRRILHSRLQPHILSRVHVTVHQIANRRTATLGISMSASGLQFRRGRNDSWALFRQELFSETWRITSSKPGLPGALLLSESGLRKTGSIAVGFARRVPLRLRFLQQLQPALPRRTRLRPQRPGATASAANISSGAGGCWGRGKKANKCWKGASRAGENGRESSKAARGRRVRELDSTGVQAVSALHR